VEIQVVFVCIPKGDNLINLVSKAAELKATLAVAGIRSTIDERDYKPGWKYNYWETRGIPFRIELGDRDLASESVMVCRRDTGEKVKVTWIALVPTLLELIEDMHTKMFTAAKQIKQDHMKVAKTFKQFMEFLNTKNVVLVPFCCGGECEDIVKLRSKDESIAQQSDETFELTGAAKSLCIPFEQPALEEGTKCFGECGANAKSWVLFGRSY